MLIGRSRHELLRPPPWSVEDIGAAFVVKDSTSQQLTLCF